jgi:aspartyl-tRNA(Asn)/glutamyl-tRNA(Gln) amidotransferase subunit A
MRGDIEPRGRKMNELLGMSLTDLTEALRAKKVSPVELMETVFDRIDETNGDLNAVVAMYDRDALRKEARGAEERIQRGEGRPLEGVPLGVKELEDVKGLVTCKGSLPFKDNVADHDSTQVARLRAAGAIVIGKTNAPEFGYTAITKNLVYGVTRNPWDLERTPGGSSGGSSAAMAGCVLPLVTASDGGGSIRIPASWTGTFGLKVSYGRIPSGPGELWEFGDTAVYGPLTKTVEDGALFLDQVAGPSPHDPNSLPHPGLSYLDAVRAGLPGKLRIGYSPDLGYAVVQSDIGEAVYDAVKTFEKAGHTVEELDGGPPRMGREWGLLGSFEQASKLHPWMESHASEFGRTFLAGLKMAWDMTPEVFGRIKKMRAELNEWCAGIFERYDLIVTPTMPYDPPPAKGPFPSETEGRQQPTAGVAAFTIPFNLSWHPAATVRVGLSRTGLPMGMQIVGRRHRDDLVLQAARTFERERPWHPQWPATWESLS